MSHLDAIQYSSVRKTTGAYAVNYIDPRNEIVVVGALDEWYLMNHNQVRIGLGPYKSKAAALEVAKKYLRYKIETIEEKLAKTQSEPPKLQSAPMDYHLAKKILGFGETSRPTNEEIKARYLSLIKKVHPDIGGSEYLTSQLNAAKDYLI